MISFPDFLKKYSTIPNSFIDDFFRLFDYKNIESQEKIINVENVVKWLDVQKHALKNTLEFSYTKNKDYIIKKVDKPKTKGGQNKEIIMITIDCFKMICQSTKSKKGKEVRQYFINVEKMMNRYKDYIIEGLEEKVIKIEKGLKPKINPQKGVIYVFRTPDTIENNLYKIGRSTQFKKRIQSHQSGLSHDIDIMFIQETDDVKAIETCVKTFMKKKQYRKYKEIYQVDIDVIKSTIQKCEELKYDIDEMIHSSELKEGGYKYYMMINTNE
jgi:phage anti-repressor protein